MTTRDLSFDEILKNIRSKLPIQNPLHTFVHNNILQTFEGLDFHTATQEAGELYRARPYWPIQNYQAKYKEGKISERDIFSGIDHYLSIYNELPFLPKLNLSGREFYYRLMFSELVFNDDEVQPNTPDETLWALCQEKVQGQKLILSRSKTKWRGKDYWEKYHNIDYALNVNPFMIRMISSYLDQGQSFWTNPFIHKGFWKFFSFDLKQTKNYLSGWQSILIDKIEKYENLTPSEIIIKELERINLPKEVWESYILDILFDLKGWSGMVNKLETEPWQATVKAPDIKLVDYIAAFLLIETSLDQHQALNHSIDLSMILGRKESIELGEYHLALALYQITKSFKLDPRWMKGLDALEVLQVIDQIDSAENKHMVSLWHEAFEHHFYHNALEAIVSHKKLSQPDHGSFNAQVLFCIDDREESIRRHVEEVDPKIKTYGVVGFFGIDMKFSSLKSERLIAQCPPVIVPSRIVREVPCGVEHKNFFKLNKVFGGSGLSLYYNSRTLVRGFLSTMLLGTASIFPMFLEVFFPKEANALKSKIKKTMNHEPQGEMLIDRGEDNYGYSKSEMAKIVQTILNICGFNNYFSPLVVMMGHGSTSTNNPFKQAYGCGACGGNAGIPNSRAFAKMANDPEVRTELSKLGVHVPTSTYFISGFHDTSTDEIKYFDLESIPQTLKESFDVIKANLAKAASLNAFERCQKFSSKDALFSPAHALTHVRERALDLAQPRPEYGHSTNALAIVGKRNFTKGLYLNRRSFLMTYDWETDPDGSIFKQVILGAIPVCVNINMDYYFSSVDNDNFGCGSKLPLNLTSLLGVMTGSQGDLRIGLARQMIEIHEPIRTLSIMECPLGRVKELFYSHPRLKNFLLNYWLRLVIHDPQEGKWYIFKEGEFKSLEVESDHLKHYSSSMGMIRDQNLEEDFAEIDNE